MKRLVAIAFAISLITGCEQTPRAPSLANEAVFQDSSLGVRFVAPEGWVLYARTTPPGGIVTKPIRIVGYQRPATDGRADLELYIADYPKSKSLIEYLREHPIGPEKWLEKSSSDLKIGSIEATNHLLVSVHQSFRQRDVWEIRRKGDRVFLFICSAMTSDRGVRDQARRAVESVTFQLD